MVKGQRLMKKVMYVFCGGTGLIRSIKLVGQETVTANCYITKCLPEALQRMNVRKPIFHHDNDNAASHSAKLANACASFSFRHDIFHRFQELNGLKYLIFGKFAYKRVLIC